MKANDNHILFEIRKLQRQLFAIKTMTIAKLSMKETWQLFIMIQKSRKKKTLLSCKVSPDMSISPLKQSMLISYLLTH